MKKIDIKKIGIILAIVIIVVLGIFLIGKAIRGNSVDEESLEKYENNTIRYYLNLSAGFNTPFGGLEALYATDETKLENLSDRQLLHTAINYVTMEGKYSTIDYATLVMLYKEEYPEIEKSGLYKAQNIRDAIKTLFGIENFSNPTIQADETFLTTYTYLAEEDIYMVSADYTNSVQDKNQTLDYTLIETTTKKDKIITTVAIAYCYQDGENKIYASDRFGENIVSENSSEFPTDKIDKFDKYQITLAQTKDGKNYIFESIKKVK